MEVMNATARYTPERCEVWAPTQNGEAALAATAEAAYRRVEASVQWSNMMLLPPPEHAVMLLAKAMSSPALADRIANASTHGSNVVAVIPCTLHLQQNRSRP